MFVLTFDTSLESFRDDLRVVLKIIEEGADLSYTSPDVKFEFQKWEGD